MLKKARVLVVEDEKSIAELVRVHLTHSGFEAVLAEGGADAQRAINAVLPDVILLDWMLPGGQSGLDLARKWRREERSKHIPIIMLTAKSEERDKVTGLDCGVDDYVTKPFSPNELMARVRAMLRRRAPERLAERVAIGALALDAEEFSVTYDGEKLTLGPTEFRMLHYLMKHPGRVHSRAVLLDKVWGDHVFIEERTVDVHIKRLRGALGAGSHLIETVRGAGYRLVAGADKTSGTAEK
ncbi:MAG: phosphate regulon transcriptional regulator PhoB [Zoogloeaceae bacterium]|jgi:two-component system phosphate regulon response regulator PhoB|nr:phosphate regulon transcriptional regulator PhoB [Zoogloeaceae bacterium]